MAPRERPDGIPYLLAILTLAVSYAAVGRIGLLAALAPGNVTPIWPASGLALAALLKYGNRYWPGVWLGSFAVNYWVAVGYGRPSFASLVGIACVASGAAIATTVAAALLRRDSDELFGRATGVVRFVVLGAIAGALIAATIGTASFFITGFIPRPLLPETWATWLLGDMVGILVVAPLLLVWSRRDGAPLSRLRMLEAIAVFLLLLAACLLVFSVERYPLSFVLIPFLLTAAFRYGQRGATLGIFAVSTVSAMLTAAGLGPFVTGGFTRNESLLLLQGFTGVVAVTLLVLSAVLAEREQNEREARDAEIRLQEARFVKHKMEEELRTAYIVESSADMISRQTPDGRLLYVSHASRSLLGFEPDELVGRSIYDLLNRDDADEIRDLQSLLMRQSGTSTLSYRIRRKDGEDLWFETTSRAIKKDGEIEEIVNVSREITDRKRAEEQIEHQVYHDALTGLPNRMLLEDRASVALARARRNHTLVAVMFLDLDRFKVVNDTLGHATGDQILQAAAKRLAETLREADTLARIGGDEFVALVGDFREVSEATIVAQKVIASMDQPFFAQGQEIHLGVSIGIAFFPQDGPDAETLLRCADRAMYRAKLLGGNGYELHTAAMAAHHAERFTLESDLRHAIERGELEVFYQPQFDLQTGTLVAAEALVRWRHPTLGLMLPDSFIPMAEGSRIIMRIGEFVLDRVCRDLTGWLSSGIPELRVAVNLSAIEFQDRNLVGMIRTILERTGAPAHLLELEITETALMHDADRTLDMLGQLKQMGIQLVIDDFGIGYSSLNYLKRFPVDSVKIDRSFVSGIDARGGDAAIISAVVQLAQSLDLRVVAEGVESEDQLRLLRREHCAHGQGFLFARPMGAEQFQAFLKAAPARGPISQ
ncbi:MAG: EAL domain-containing protein [Thermoanaerobaculia bacterium]|nr:EAL domain-containing protein [Thermoanaerobaculia bacterium]